MTDKEATLFDLNEYEEQKFEEFRPFMFYSGVVISFFALSLWMWDYTINSSAASATFKWRVLMALSYSLSSSGYLYLRLPRKWYFVSVTIGVWVAMVSFETIAGILQEGASYQTGGFARGLAVPVVLAMGVGRWRAIASLAMASTTPFLFLAVGITKGLSLSVISAYTLPFFVLCALITFALDVLFRRIYMARKQLLAEKMRAEHATVLKNQFLSLVSHDLRGPIGAIRGYMDLMLENRRLPENEMNLALHTRDTVNFTLKVIENLLNIGRLHTGSIKPELRRFELQMLVAEKTIRLGHKAQSKGISIKIEIPEKTVWLADEALVGQVVQNLIDNAVKFTPTGGTIAVSLADERTLCVRNTGAGIPESILPHLFRHEVKTSHPGTHGEGGTGLGLPLSSDLIKAHGGELTAENEPGKGAAFYIRMPESVNASGPEFNV
jgi:signal transduction histidine kinase